VHDQDHAHAQPLPTHVDAASASFAANREAMLAALAEVDKQLAKARAGGGEKYVTRHRERGKLLARERVERLLDPDAHFLEIAPLAGAGLPGVKPGASMVAGVGVVGGVECGILANDPTIQGGAISEIGVLKGHRLADIAMENRLPTISLIESAGADLPNQSKIFVPGGRTFRDITRRSKQRLPSVCVVFGSSTAGGAYIPGMSDYVVMVKEQAQVYLAGPPLVKMATGEETDDESLGGADMHSRVSGVSDYLAEDEEDALAIAREIMAGLAWTKGGPGPVARPEAPLHDPEELLGIASADVRVPFPAREVIARVVDGSRFHEFKPLYGPTLVTGWARIHGWDVGILANDGILFSESARKGAQFIQLCNQRRVPLVFLQNITGFMVGERYERDGIIRNGAKLVNAVSNSEVPAITIMTGASYGAGNYAMCGRAYAPRFLFSWPNHKIAVMGGEQLAGVLDIIKRQSAARRGIELDEEHLGQMKEMVRLQIEGESTALFATARLWDDGIIDPRDTRTVLGIALSAACSAPVDGSMAFGVFRH
jgi:acetyl-CoA carboxylase carboxyltransferase component